MADRKSQMLPTGTAALRRGPKLPSYPDAFADAFVANFPKEPTLAQKRDGYVEILVRQGVPFDEAMQQAVIAIPSATPSAVPAAPGGSSMLPSRPPAPHELGRGQDTEMIHVRPDEIPAIQDALNFPGTVNPRSGYLEFGGGKPGEDRMSQSEAGRAGSRGSAGGAGGGERTYKDPDLGGLVTGYGSPIHTNMSQTYGGIQATQNPSSWASTKDQVSTYNKAAREWNGDLLQNNLLGLALPFGLQNVAPKYSQPATYTGGTYHFGMNPAAAAGGVAGMFMGPAGVALGPVMGKGYQMVGGNNLVFSGPDVPAGWRSGIDPSANGAAPASGSGGNQSPPGSGGDRTASAGNDLLPPITGNSGGAAGSGALPPTGSALPPINAPVVYPGAYRRIPGPSEYGWRRPSWTA